MDVNARHLRRRAAVVVLLTVVLPAAYVSWALVASHAPAGFWAVVVLPGPLVYGSGFLWQRRAAAAVALTLADTPGAVFVLRAMDPAIVPRGLRLLIADGTGLRLCGSRRRRYPPVWELRWADVARADLGMIPTRTGTRTAVVLHLRSGGLTRLGLPDPWGITNPLPLAQETARTINQRAGAALPP